MASSLPFRVETHQGNTKAFYKFRLEASQVEMANIVTYNARPMIVPYGKEPEAFMEMVGGDSSHTQT